jgi:glutamate racemase
MVAQEYLAPLIEIDVDVLILGCTHYPLMRDLIGSVMGPAVTLVDSAEEAARDVRALLEDRGWLRSAATPPAYSFTASDAPLRFREVGRRLIGDIVNVVERVDVEDPGRAA